MTITRRNILKAAGALGLAATIPGCGDDDALPPMLDAGPADGGPPDAGEPDAGPVPPLGPFRHGVASGDPLAEAVILWTRYTPNDPTSAGDVMVAWEVAMDAPFAALAASGNFTTSAARDFTVKVDATGLAAATTYYYRFRVGSDVSPIGRTKTAPSGSVSRLRFAVASCSSYAHGYFLGYREIARRLDLDAVLHLGDYIYEYATGSYGNVRDYDPPDEIVTLADYRRRYAHYRLDPDLREAHRQHPWITTWDDHETTNDAWRDGAENHQASEGDYGARKTAAAQAYAEWMPLRDQSDPAKIWRAFTYGDLAEIVVLDSRRWGREEQASGMGDPAVNDPARQLLGADQETFAFERLTSTTARWKLVAQQVVVAPFPLIFNTDAWDGYPAARNRFFDTIETNGLDDVVVLTGDIHMSIAADLPREPTNPATYDPSTGRGSLAVELVAPGITSPGLSRGIAGTLDGRIRSAAPHAKAWNLWQRGYYVLDVTPERTQAAWFHFADVARPTGDESFGFAVSTATGENHLVVDEMPAAPSSAPPAAP
jgi:alkaline phosphatase D